MISGYLFFRNFPLAGRPIARKWKKNQSLMRPTEGEESRRRDTFLWWEKVMEKWKRRIPSVLIPYLLWNLLYYLGYVVGSRLPWFGKLVGNGAVLFNLAELWEAVLHYRYLPVFWYLYQLIGLIAMAPVLYLVLRRYWSSALFFIGVWSAIIWKVRLPYLNADALLYYGTAAFLALHEHTREAWVERSADRKMRGVGLLFLFASALSYYIGLKNAWVSCFVLTRLLAVGGCWLVVDQAKLKPSYAWVHHNFFFYAIHFAWVRLINKCGAELLYGIAWVPVILYGIMPILVVGIGEGIGVILRKKTPFWWKLLTGNR